MERPKKEFSHQNRTKKLSLYRCYSELLKPTKTELLVYRKILLEMGCEISSVRQTVYQTPRRNTSTESSDVKKKKKKNKRPSLKSVANLTKMVVGSSASNGTKRRNSVLYEMMETERKYVDDLERIRDMYLFPLASKIYLKDIPLKYDIKAKDVPTIKEGEFKSLFAALQDVLRANQDYFGFKRNRKQGGVFLGAGFS